VKRFVPWQLVIVVLILGSIGLVAGCRPSVDKPVVAITTVPPPSSLPSPSVTTGSFAVSRVSPAVTTTPAILTRLPDQPAEEPQPGPPPEELVITNPAPRSGGGSEEPAPGEVPGMAPIPLELPAPAFRGTPVPLDEPNVEKPRGAPRPPFYAPEGTKSVARGKPTTASDPQPVAGEIDFLTDGDKEASDFGYLELRPGTEWVQVDLGRKTVVYAIVLWHNHAEARVYRDVVVQISDDPDFLEATTVFNNDYDNSSGLGVGQQMGYVETSEGKLIDCKGVEGRYVRIYGRGNNIDDKNHYTEVEVFGKPAE